MKIVKPGREQTGWAKEYDCTVPVMDVPDVVQS